MTSDGTDNGELNIYFSVSNLKQKIFAHKKNEKKKIKH